MKDVINLMLVYFFLTIPLFAQKADSTFTVDVELRPRFELRNGFKAPIEKGEDPAAS